MFDRADLELLTEVVAEAWTDGRRPRLVGAGRHRRVVVHPNGRSRASTACSLRRSSSTSRRTDAYPDAGSGLQRRPRRNAGAARRSAVDRFTRARSCRRRYGPVDPRRDLPAPHRRHCSPAGLPPTRRARADPPRARRVQGTRGRVRAAGNDVRAPHRAHRRLAARSPRLEHACTGHRRPLGRAAPRVADAPADATGDTPAMRHSTDGILDQPRGEPPPPRRAHRAEPNPPGRRGPELRRGRVPDRAHRRGARRRRTPGRRRRDRARRRRVRQGDGPQGELRRLVELLVQPLGWTRSRTARRSSRCRRCDRSPARSTSRASPTAAIGCASSTRTTTARPGSPPGRGGITWPRCIGPVSYIGQDAIAADIAHFKAALAAANVERGLHDVGRPGERGPRRERALQDRGGVHLGVRRRDARGVPGDHRRRARPADRRSLRRRGVGPDQPRALRRGLPALHA